MIRLHLHREAGALMGTVSPLGVWGTEDESRGTEKGGDGGGWGGRRERGEGGGIGAVPFRWEV